MQSVKNILVLTIYFKTNVISGLEKQFVGGKNWTEVYKNIRERNLRSFRLIGWRGLNVVHGRMGKFGDDIFSVFSQLMWDFL